MLSIIIVNYLQKDLLLGCVESVYNNLSKNSFEIIIVNNSKEEQLAEISAKYPLVKFIPNENTGFSKANNLAFKQASGEYLLFLNADTEILADFTNDLIKKFKNIKYGAIGLKLKFTDGGFQNSFGLFPSVLNEYRNRKIEIAFRRKDKAVISKREKEYSEIKEVDWVTGAALFVKKAVFEEVGGFDERYFLYYEDIDLCFRLHQAGYRNYYYPFTDIIHHKGEYTRSGFTNEAKKIQNTSQLLYYKLHKGLLQNLLLKFIKIFM
jgi:N-acetylglucosaminyl-diphospho-decaprenol L-rhamnosyltransferase